MPGYNPRHIALVATVLLADLLLTGVIFGWAPLLLMLEEEGQYSELCSPEDLEGAKKSGIHDEALCAAQENELNLVYAVASVAMNAGSLLFGMLLDFSGPTLATTLAGIVDITGLFLMAVSDSESFDAFLPGYMLLAFGGSMTMMASFPASFLILEHQTAILAAISCLFDGSSIVFVVLYSLKSITGASRTQLFFGLAVIAVCVYLTLIILWKANEKDLESANTNSNREHKPLIEDHTISVNHTMPQYGSISPAERKAMEEKMDRLELADVSVRHQFFSFEFAFIVIFAAVQILRANTYIGTTNKLLENYGDADHGRMYTEIFSVVLPFGFIFVPAIDHVVEKKGLSFSLLVTCGLGVAYNLLVFVPVLPIQVVSFILFTCFRAFLYTVVSAFIAKTFGLRNMGTLVGTVFTLGAGVSLLEYPAVYISNTYFGGSLTVINMLSLLLCIVMIPYTFVLQSVEQDRLLQLLRLKQKLGTAAPMPNTVSPGVRNSPVAMRHKS